MSEKKGVIGGFVAFNTNTGKIEDCYCVTKFNGRKMTAGGFVGENAGNILTSFCQFISNGLSGGFCGKSSTLSKDCYFVADNKQKEKKAETLWDKSHVLKNDAATDQNSIKQVGFDSDITWEYNGKKAWLRFQTDNWFYNNAFESAEKNIVKIKTAEQLIQFAELVNNGNPSVVSSWVMLEKDIDLKGKTWTPIGLERVNGFSGIFDGNGHTIKNFSIKSDDYSKKGFFGYLRGRVYNLSLDCVIKGDGVIGAIAAVNEGEIGYCGVTISCVGKGDDINIGGLVGTNSGRIFKSFAAGTIKFVLFPIIPILILLSAMTVATATVVTIGDFSDDTIYNDIPSDPEQERLPKDELVQQKDKDTVNSKMNTISFTFYEQIDVDTATGDCVLDFVNPAKATNKIVVKLMMDEAEAEAAFGGKSWSNSYYLADQDRVVLAESGAIEPGYILKSLKLNNSAKDNLDNGDYSGVIVLYAYDDETGELANVQTELPVELSIY